MLEATRPIGSLSIATTRKGLTLPGNHGETRLGIPPLVVLCIRRKKKPKDEGIRTRARASHRRDASTSLSGVRAHEVASDAMKRGFARMPAAFGAELILTSLYFFRLECDGALILATRSFSCFARRCCSFLRFDANLVG